MKFAENNRISHRQLYRQMVLAFLAPFHLCLPGENRVTGISGIVGVAAALVLLVIYSFFLRRLTPWYTDPIKTFGNHEVPVKLHKDVTAKLTVKVTEA